MHERESPLSIAKSSGRPKALTDQQTMIFVGWVLDQNRKNERVDLHRSGRFIEHQFGVEAGEETVRRYLVQNGFSSRKGRRRTAGYKLDLEVLIDLSVEDVQRFWELGIKDMSPQYVACIDSSAIGWRLLTRKTYFPKGGAQPKIREGNPSYTNAVVWATFPDGVNRCPALLFAGDPQLSGALSRAEQIGQVAEKVQH
jgi:hypothetical protein